MTGLPPDTGTAFLNYASEMVVVDAWRFEPGTTTTELAGGAAMPVIRADDTSALTAVEYLYGEVEALQIVWTDSQGRLPWDEGYANPPGSQPLLGQRPA